MTTAPSSLPPFAELRPDLLKEWNTEKNGELDPNSFSAGSTRKVWWRCAADPRHEWEAVIGNRARKGKGCPFCVGQRTLPEETFAALYPKQLREWHPTKNAHLNPVALSPSSQERVWWQCSVDPTHEWDTLLFVRTKRGDKGCPFCTGRRASTKNSLATLFPEIAAEWHPTKNGNMTPREVLAKTHHRVWWKCKTCLFEWQTAINMRTVNKSNCPLCSRDSGAIGSKRTLLEKQEAAEATYDFDTDDTSLVFDYRAIQTLLTSRVKVTSELKKIESALGARLVSKTNYQPYYQRNYVWDTEKQTYFIESVLIGTEVPPLIFYEQINGFEVIDGRQRFETLLRFQNNQLQLSAKGLSVRLDLAQKRFKDLTQQDQEAFFDSKLRLIQFAVVDPDAVGERPQDMLKKEIFRRYNSGITPLKQVEVDRAIYIEDEPTQFIKEKLKQNPFLYGMFTSLFLTGGMEAPEANPTDLEKALQEVRFLLVCAQMPILSTRKKESLQRFYEWYSESHEDAHAIYREFLKHVTLVDKLRTRLLEAGWVVSKFWNEVMYWAAAVMEREGKVANRLLDESTASKLIELYAQNELAYVPGEGQFLYGQFLHRYSTIAGFIEREFGLSLNSYLRKRRQVDQPVATPSVENEEAQVFSRIEKQDPTSLNVEDICNDIKRSKFMLRPSYQRGEVINRAKSSGIIESILLGIKLPPLYIFRRNDGVSEVIDGQQRILSILGFVGQPFLNENNDQVFSEKNGFQLNRLRILDHLNGKSFGELEPSQQERIWDFGLSVIAIEERFNPGFSPVDLFIRLNSRPYPIKENTFEMWNSYVDKEIIDLIKKTAASCGNWFYITRQNDRMRNEELVTLLSYLAFTQVTRNENRAPLESVIDVFRRSSGINVRVKQKTAITRVLDNATALPETKADVIEALKRTDSFIRKIRTLLIDEDAEHVENVEEYLNAQLTRLFNVNGTRYYVRKLKDFYALWYVTFDLGKEVLVRRRAEIRKDVDRLFQLMREESADKDGDTTDFLARVENFRKKYATEDRKLKLSVQEKRDMIRRQGNKCPLCGEYLSIHDDSEGDHIVSLAAQGADGHENLQVTHMICNRKKGVSG